MGSLRLIFDPGPAVAVEGPDEFFLRTHRPLQVRHRILVRKPHLGKSFLKAVEAHRKFFERAFRHEAVSLALRTIRMEREIGVGNLVFRLPFLGFRRHDEAAADQDEKRRTDSKQQPLLLLLSEVVRELGIGHPRANGCPGGGKGGRAGAGRGRGAASLPREVIISCHFRPPRR